MTKDELVAKFQSVLDEQEINLKNLQAKVAEGAEDLSSDFQKAIDDLEPNIEQAKTKLAEVVDSADDQWDGLVESLEEGWDEIKNKFDVGWDNLADSVSNVLPEGSKEEFLEKAQASITAQQEKLGQLKQKVEEGAGELADDVAGEYNKAIENLELSIDHAKEKFAEISNVADHRWDYMKSSAEKGWDDVKNKFEGGFDDFAESVKKLFS